MGQLRWLRASDRLEHAEGLDRVVSPVQRIVRKIPPGAFRDALHGVWLGHPLHPILVQVPVGAWISAAFLDVTPDGERHARHLIGVGLLASVPAALAETDLSLARLGEGHADALAILDELGAPHGAPAVPGPPFPRWGVWAARPPGPSLAALQAQGRRVLRASSLSVVTSARSRYRAESGFGHDLTTLGGAAPAGSVLAAQ